MRDFVAEAERTRRAGDAHAAVELAEAGLAAAPQNDRGRVALALALLDLGDLPRARYELERAFEIEPPVTTGIPPRQAIGLGGDLGDDELEHAFAAAETNPDEMMSANKVVEQTLENEQAELPEAGFDVTESLTYATETMVSLLEEQGRANDAEALREFLVYPEAESCGDSATEAVAVSGVLDATETEWGDAGVGPSHARRLRIVATLEGWLLNLRQSAEQDSRERSRVAGGPSLS